MSHGGLDRFRSLLSPAEFEQLRQAVRRPLPVAIRINTLKIAIDDACRDWPQWYGWWVQPVPFCDAGWQVTGEPIAQTLEHKMGFFYIQDAASMLPAEMFSFEQDEPLVLDMAAAPGGKATHLVCKMDGRGLLVANDATGHRIPPLRDKLQDWGTMNAVITNYPGERFGEWYPETFDRVLVDAPCTGDSLRWAERRKPGSVSPRIRQAFHEQQLALLISAFWALKPGGEVVYATCSLAPEEDEAVLDAFLGLYPQATVESAGPVLSESTSALTSYGERQFHPQVRRAVRLWPHLYDTAGFFAALIRKRDSVSVRLSDPPTRPLASVGFDPMGHEEESWLCDYLLQSYGFDLGAVIERQALTLWMNGASAYAIPQCFVAQFADLPCVATGMRVGERVGEDFAPSHELVARFGAWFTERRLRLSEQQREVWLAGREMRGMATGHSAGTIVLLEDERGRFLGLGKILPNRIRNLLPRRLIY
jgi:16S rRNA (cytosine1407-C5)-methyltransferase